MYESSGNHTTEKKWVAHIETIPLLLTSPTTCAKWIPRLSKVNIRKLNSMWNVGLCSNRTIFFIPFICIINLSPCASQSTESETGKVVEQPLARFLVLSPASCVALKSYFTFWSLIPILLRGKKYNYICNPCSVRTRKSIAISIDHR